MLIVPLGDPVHRRRLVCRLLLLASLGLLLTAVAPSLAVPAVAIGVVGITSVAAQILVPLASELAGEEDGGRVVGVVMSGLLIGILVARTVSGQIAGVAGWRSVYLVGAAVMLALTVALWRALPDTAPASSLPYRRLLASVGTLVLAGWGFLALGTTSLAAVIVGILLLDLGVQGQHILNQSTIYALSPEARSRVTTRSWAGGAITAPAAPQRRAPQPDATLQCSPATVIHSERCQSG